MEGIQTLVMSSEMGKDLSGENIPKVTNVS
jgi:hypothetical protein